MAVSRTTVLPLTTYPAGTRTISARNLNNNIIGYSLEIARCTTATPTIWPDPTSTIEINIEVSFDGGITWVGGGGFSAYGGIHTRWNGEEAATSQNFEINIPPGNGRKIRVTVSLSHAIYTTATLATIS